MLFIAEIVLRYTVFKVRRHSFAPLSGSGGDNEIRTHDPLLARQVLSQLSYTPTNPDCDSRRISSSDFVFMCSRMFVYATLTQSRLP